MVLMSLNIFAMTGDEIFKNYIDNSERDSRIIMEMKYVDESGKTVGVRVAEQWKTRDDKNLVKIAINSKKPASVKGERLLVVQNSGRENDVWEYTPSIKKIRRLLANEFANSYLGAPDGTITNEDRAAKDIKDYTTKLLREEELSGEACYVIEVKNKKKSQTQYSKEEYWIVKDKWVALKHNFYKDGKLIKEELVKGIIEVEGGYFYKMGVMKNLESGKMVVYRMPKALFGDSAKVKEKIFTQRYLETGVAR